MIADLQRARIEQVNRESAARLAKQNADQATVKAQTKSGRRRRSATAGAADIRCPAG